MANSSNQIFAADALRFSFEEHSNESGSFEPLAVRAAKVFELNPTNSSATNLRLDKTVNLLQGFVPYWNAKTDNADIPGIDTVDDNLPEVLNNGHLGTVGGAEDGEPITTLLTLTEDGEDGYFYNYAKIRVWLEGWDPDSFDAILNANFSITLSFNVASPVALP